MICPRCGLPKEESEFRIRVDKRVKYQSGLIYRNNVCLSCEAAAQRARYEKQKNDPVYKAKHAVWALAAHKKYREKNIARMKIKRGTPEYKKYMRAYRDRNKDKIFQQEVITKKRYHEKNRDALTDVYISGLLKCSGKEISNEAIQEKREKIIEQRKRLGRTYDDPFEIMSEIQAAQKKREQKPYEFIKQWRD